MEKYMPQIAQFIDERFDEKLKQFIPQLADMVKTTVTQTVNDLAKKYTGQNIEALTSQIQTQQTPGSSEPQTQTQTPGLDIQQAATLGQIGQLFGLGKGSEIIPVDAQKQILANVMANALTPPDRFGDFLKGFNTALHTMVVMTRKKMPTLEAKETFEETV